MALATSQTTVSIKSQRSSYLFPLMLVTSLFFLWGLAYGLLDVLNKHFQELLNITKTRSTLLQAAYFGAYFLVALPAGVFMNKYGYKKGIVTGLLLYTAGALLFFPSAEFGSYNFFLLSLFILASGLTFLETAANPYITVLGKQETSEFRLNLSQSFNGVGAFIGPIIGAMSVIVVFTILTTMDIPFFNAMKPFLFTNHMLNWKGFFDRPVDKKEVLKSALFLLGHIVFFVSLAVYIFRKKDILS